MREPLTKCPRPSHRLVEQPRSRGRCHTSTRIGRKAWKGLYYSFKSRGYGLASGTQERRVQRSGPVSEGFVHDVRVP